MWSATNFAFALRVNSGILLSKVLLISTHNVFFHGDKKNSNSFVREKNASS